MEGMVSFPLWPNVRLQLDLSGQDGGQHMLVAKAVAACRREKIPEDDIKRFRADIAHCQEYTAILATVARWIDFNGGEYLAHGKWIR